MPNWTKEQEDAIKRSGTNIIVSAGAGSGKTAVLTERVIDKLSKKVKINELLILTFTNAAAAEMKDRIRKKINQHEELKDNLDLLDSSYITTFDSYTLSLVKKYNYILGVSPKLNIIDNSIISLVKKEYMDEVFEELYKENNIKFNKLINDFCIKNDNNLKESILALNNKISMKSNKDEYLNSYLDTYYSNDMLESFTNEYIKLILSEIDNIETNMMLIESLDYPKYYEKLEPELSRLICCRNYDDIKRVVNDIKLPTRPRDSEDLKEFKNSIDVSIKNIKAYTRFSSKEEINEISSLTKDYVEVILDIINRFDKKVNKYKEKNDLYEFIDIELMAIKLLKENENIRNELRNYYHEIMVDEYQDTNDLQEEFINLIENNNIYMVGDIKQSIYGFRNANPSIFKNKYDKYSKNDGGEKIDLMKNFRSRSEVLDGINEIFNLVMDNTLGGADYPNGHEMIFGNINYEKELDEKQDYKLELYNYPLSDEYTKEELECFIIGNDIKNKLKNEYKVVDKDTNKLRLATYKDFCIIMDRGTYFDTYSKIFEYLGIPLNIYEDKRLTSETDILLLNNLLGFVLKVHDKNEDTDFKYYFMSIARSYLYEMPDKEILKVINKKSYNETDMYKIAESIDIETLSSYELIEIIIDKYNFYEKLIRNGNINDSIIRIENILKTAESLTGMGYTIHEFKDYLTEIIDSGEEIKYAGKLDSSDSVKIMNIHKSKGLEFSVCYFSGYHAKFNTSDIKERFVYNNNYGIITPYFKEGIGSTILKDLLKNKYNEDNISERIRLIYVALTRAKEKMIIVTSLDDAKMHANTIVDLPIRLRYNSFLSMMNSISDNLKNHITNIDINSLELTSDYKISNGNKEIHRKQTNDAITYHKVEILNEELDEKHASKTINELITKDNKDVLEYGTMMHEMFERTDFLNLDKDSKHYDVLNNFVRIFNINSNTKIYKEHEFMFEQDGVNYHGIIDLVLINDNEVKIVDYKLKNIDDPHYEEQLKVYYDYLKTIFDKEITCYLYSIINGVSRKLNIN